MKKQLVAMALVVCVVITACLGIMIPTSGANDTDGKFTSQELRLFGETGGVTLPIGSAVHIELADRFNGIDTYNGTDYVPEGKIAFYYSKNTGKTDIADVIRFEGVESNFGKITDEIAQKYGITKGYYGVWYEGTVDTSSFDIGDKIYIYDAYEKTGDDDRYAAVAGKLLKNRNFIMVADTSAAVSVTGNAVYGDNGQLSAVVTTSYTGSKYTINQILTGTLEFFVGGTSIGTVNTTDGAGSIDVPKDKIPAVGDYDVKVVFTPSNTGISSKSEATDTLTVEPRPITLKPNNVNVRVDDTLPAIEVGVSSGSFGFNDTLATLGTVSATYAIGSTATVHNEDITIANQAAIIAANPNYAFTFETGELKVAAANVAPTIENITFSDAPTNEPVEVTFTIGDDATPVDDLVVVITDENQQTITPTRDGSTITFIAPANGNYNITVTDSEGLFANDSVYINSIDDQKPVVNNVINNTTGLVNAGYNVTAKTTDDIAVEKIKVTDPEGNESIYNVDGQPSSQASIDFPVIMNGDYSVIAIDIAGNESEAFTVAINNIDMVAPTIGTITKDEELTNEAVSVTIPMADNVGLDKFFIAKDDSNPIDYSFDDALVSSNVMVEITENGNYTVMVVDIAGNVSETATFIVNNIDKVPPAIDNIEADTTILVKDKVTTTVDVSDNKELDKVTVTSPNGVATDYPVTGTSDDITFDADANGDWTITVTDKAGNTSQSSTLTVNNIDTVAPVIESVTADTTTIVKDKVEVTVDVTDNKLLSEITITSPSGATTTKTVTGTTDEIKFDANENGNWTIVVTDKAGNTSQSSTLTVNNIDTIAPVIGTITKVEDTDTDSAEVTVPVTDNKELSKVTIVSPSGATTTHDVTGTSDSITFTADELGDWTITVTDKAGNTSQPKTVTVSDGDTIKPVIGTVTYDSSITKEKVEVTVPVTDNKELDKVVVKDPDGNITEYPITPGKKAESVAFDASKNGDYEIVVMDKAGNSSVAKTLTIDNIDTVAPIVEALTGDTTTITKTAVEITANVTDNKELAKVTVTSPSGVTTTKDVTGTADEIKFNADANGVWTVIATDKAGNVSSSKTITIANIDTVAPVVESVVGDTTTVTKEPVEVTVNVTDNKELAAVTITSPSGTTTTTGATGTSDEIKFYANENGTYKVVAKDKAGNVSSEKTITFSNFDTIAPVVNTITADITTITKNPIETTVKVTDNKELASITITSPSGVTTTKTVTGIADEIKFNADENGTWTVTTTDKAGNVSTAKTITFNNIDTIAPVVDDVSYDTSITKDPVEVTVKVSDNKSLATATITSPSGATTTKTVTGTADEFKFNANENGQWKVVVKDTAGNVSLEKKFNINSQDTVAPVIENVTPSTTDTTNSSVTVKVDITDDVELSKVSVKDPEGNVTDYPIEPGKTASSITFDADKNGTYQIIVEDKAGNSSTAKNFTVDNIDKIAPIVEKTEFDADSVVNDSVEVSIEVTDNKELKEVTITSPSGVVTTKPVSGTTDSLKINADENGEWTVIVTDKAGNVSTEKKFTIGNIDKIPPVIEATTPDITEPTNSTITVKVDITDNVELEKVLIKDPKGNITEKLIEPGKTSSSITFDVTDNGEYEITVIDKSGNSSTTKIVTIDNIDVIAPEASTDIDEGYIKITATDSGSGVDKIVVIYPDGSSIDVTDSSKVQITASGEYEIIVIDKAGNSTSKKVQIDPKPAPPTADTSNVLLYLILLALSCTGLAAGIIKKNA